MWGEGAARRIIGGVAGRGGLPSFKWLGGEWITASFLTAVRVGQGGGGGCSATVAEGGRWW